jgi:paraquat-inducible protein A
LIACPECDLLQRAPRAARTGIVCCRRCDAPLYRLDSHALEYALALSLAAAVLIILANSFPVMSLDLQGRDSATSLFGMSRALHEAGMSSVAVLVFATLILAPAAEVLALLYLLTPLQLGFVARGFVPVARLLVALRPWGMVEVFVLGALASIGRLSQVADVGLGLSFWCLGALMFVFAAIDAVFDSRAMWARAASLGLSAAAGRGDAAPSGFGGSGAKRT